MHSSPQQPTPTDAPAVGANRRAQTRYRFPPGRSCRFVAWPDCRCRRATLFDVSAGGLGLLLDEPPELGWDVVVQLPVAGQSGVRSLSGRVAHAMRQPDGRWLAGCALWRPLSEADVAALLQSDAPPPRRPVTHPSHVLKYPPLPSRPHSGLERDLSSTQVRESR